MQCNSNQNGIIKHANVDIKIILAYTLCENSKYLKSIADTSVIQCDEITTVMDIILTNVASAIATNVTCTASINCHSKKARDCFIFHTIILVIILLLIIIIICYYYANQNDII